LCRVPNALDGDSCSDGAVVSSSTSSTLSRAVCIPRSRSRILPLSMTRPGNSQQIVSPFDDSRGTDSSSSTSENEDSHSTSENEGTDSSSSTSENESEIDWDAFQPLSLTLENVELVLDEMRPFLIADGGNVTVTEIDGNAVRLELQGACGTCPSSATTMKMGLERKLKARIPSITEVTEKKKAPEGKGKELNRANLETVLDTIRPFLSIAGGEVHVHSFSASSSSSPSAIVLKMGGPAAYLHSVKAEIVQRIRTYFQQYRLGIEWAD
jgi:Fe-S cluster biogenesis protein NfuA